MSLRGGLHPEHKDPWQGPVGVVLGCRVQAPLLTPGLPFQCSDPKPVSKLRVQKQTNTSISLGWDAPQGSHPNSTYWVQWAGQGDRNETQSTKDTTYTATGLKPESWYDFSVWVEEGGVNSSPENLSAATGEGLPGSVFGGRWFPNPGPGP